MQRHGVTGHGETQAGLFLCRAHTSYFRKYPRNKKRMSFNQRKRRTRLLDFVEKTRLLVDGGQ
jgi:hypothetical protein